MWGQFATPLILDNTPTSLATLSVTRLEVGITALDLLNFDAFTGGWFDADFNGPLDVQLNSYSIVPLPSAVLFMMGGLGALAGLRRRC